MPEKEEKQAPRLAETIREEDEMDEWDKRILRTGCGAENDILLNCWHEKKDWRACAPEMDEFKKCWMRNRNHERTAMKNAEKK